MSLLSPDDKPEKTHSFPRGSGRWLALAGLFLSGLGLRLFRLSTVPLGGHGDVAWNGLIALDWLQRGLWPFYVYHIYAPEPVIFYLTGLSILLFGPTFFAARFVTALASALVIAVGYGAARWLSDSDRDSPSLISRTMWIVALAYAVSFYPIILSQTGQRAQVFPLLVMGLAALFAYAWRSGRWWAFAGAAIVMALANYTYIPARLMPVMVALWAGHQFFADRRRCRARWRQLVAMAALSAVLVVPQLVVYLQTPEAFFARSDQAAGRFIFQSGLSGAELWATLGRKVLGELAIFFLPWRGAYAEMGRPLLSLPLAIGAVIGLLAAFKRPDDRALWWPISGIPIMFLTDVVSGTQPEPHGLRMIGVMPLAFLLAARGLALVWGWVEQALHAKGVHRLASLAGPLTAALIVLPGLADFWAYHWRYVPARRSEADISDRLEASDVFLAELILRHAGEGRPILITLDDFTRPNVTYLLSGAYPIRRSALAADGSLSLPGWGGSVLIAMPVNPYRPRHDGLIPEHDGRSWVMLADGQMALLPPLTEEAARRLHSVLETAPPLDTVKDWSGQPVAGLYEADLAADDFDLLMIPIGANLNGEIELVGYQVDSQTLQPGRPLWITLYWRAIGGAVEDYETFVQVWDANGEAVSQVHRWTLAGVYRTRLWQAGEIVPTRFRLDIPPDLPSGTYAVVVGLYRVLANTSLPVVDAEGRPVAERVMLSGFKVALPPAQVTHTPPESLIQFGGTIELAGLDVALEDQTLIVWADWRTLSRPLAAHTVFIHVTGPDDSIYAQLDTQPRGGTYPTTIWEAGEVVPDEYRIPLPDDLPAGVYTVYMGWYTLPNGERLSADVGTSRSPDDRVAICTFSRP
jgi:4-amino-4-deoxy-L-arabinose transferase-like glycosyltransferase